VVLGRVDLNFSLQNAITNLLKRRKVMSLTRRKFIKTSGGAAAAGMAIPAGFYLARQINNEFELTPEIAVFLGQWTSLAKFKEKAPNVTAGPMWGGIRRCSVRWFVTKYFQKNGDVPNGEQRIVCTYGIGEPCDVHISYVDGVQKLDEIFYFPGGDVFSVTMLKGA
jgi:hypothetical protein